MKKKRLFGAFAVILAVSLLLVGCNNSKSTSSTNSTATNYVAPVATKGTIQMEAGYDNAAVLSTFSAEVADFQTLYPMIKVVVTNVGTQNYDTLMQVKLAANDMPDVYGTAGWLNMFAPVSTTLNYEPWVSKIVPGIKQAVTDTAGDIKALPLNFAADGLEYNTAILSQYGINPDTSLKTMDQWLTAAKTIHDKSNGSVYAMYIGGGDGWPLGLFYNFMADNAFVNNNNPDGASLIAGTYDWSTWPAFVTKMKTFFAYVNPDYLTAKNNSQIDDMAKGIVAFDWGSGDIPAVLQENSDMKWSFVPLPAWKAGDQPAFVGDVHDTLAIWNKSTVSDDARLFLDFWADPTNMKMLCDIDGMQAGLTGVTVNGIDTARYATFKNNVVMSMFDQHELPNGMWNDLVKGAAEFNSGAETAQQWADDMKTSYTRLYAAAHAAS